MHQYTLAIEVQLLNYTNIIAALIIYMLYYT